jgi:hypothetical protein
MNRIIKKTTLIAIIAAMLIAPSMATMQAHASVPPLYDLRGTWTFNYYYPIENPTTYTHTMMITSFNAATGEFSGTGYYNADHLLNWTVTGTETVGTGESLIDVSFLIAYNQSSYFVNAMGRVNSNTYMSGSADGYYSPPGSYRGPASWDATKTNWSPDPNVQLTFPPGSDIQSVTVDTTTNYPPPPRGAIGPIYNITVTGTFGGFTPSIATSTTGTLRGKVTIGIHYDPNLLNGRDESKLNLGQFDFLLGDVNHDGKVNLVDLLIITKALCSKLGSRNWNPNADLNGDRKVDLKDLCLALKNFGKTAHWIDITSGVDTVNNIVYGATDHFSGFGVH